MALSTSQQFFNQWMEILCKKGTSNKSLSLDKYNDIMAKLKIAIAKPGNKTPEEYSLMRRFDMVAANGIHKLIKKRTKDDDQFLYYVANEELFDKIVDAHRELGHGGIKGNLLSGELFFIIGCINMGFCTFFCLPKKIRFKKIFVKKSKFTPFLI